MKRRILLLTGLATFSIVAALIALEREYFRERWLLYRIEGVEDLATTRNG